MDKAQQQQLGEALRKAERNRKFITLLRIPLYGIMVAWFAFVFFAGFVKPELMAQAGQSVLTWIIPVVAVMIVFQLLFSRCYSNYARLETETMRRILADLHPGARYHEQAHQLSLQELRSCKFFGRVETHSAVPAQVFCSMELPTQKSSLNLYDLGVVSSRKSTDTPSLGGIAESYKMIFRMFFAQRLENTMFGFRGLFARVELPTEVAGCVVVLPDHLESKAGHMARSVQSRQEFDGNRLVQMEDPEFESYFAVYATDEVLARRVLTPAVMRTLTTLRLAAGKDAYFSFTGRTFCFAFSMPEGLLTLKGVELDKIVSSVSDKLGLAERTLRELKIE